MLRGPLRDGLAPRLTYLVIPGIWKSLFDEITRPRHCIAHKKALAIASNEIGAQGRLWLYFPQDYKSGRSLGWNTTQLYLAIISSSKLQRTASAATKPIRETIQANMSTVNMVKYYFYKGMVPKDQDRLRQLVALAYQTARDRKLYPKAVLIRCVLNPFERDGAYMTFLFPVDTY